MNAPRPHGSALDLADRAFARASGALPIDGNAVRLLLDASGNYPVWLEAIAQARHAVLFEMYILDDDRSGRSFADALAERARSGVAVHVVVDWMGSRGSGRLLDELRAAGAQVRVFNPPRLASPLGWVTRDHRKTIVIDGHVGFVSGLCISDKWVGNPAKRMEPWRDTGIELRGPAVADLAAAFAQVWQACGEPLPPGSPTEAREAAGDTRLRVIAGVPNATGTYRLDLAIASLARKHLWLTDAYFVGTSAYVQSLAAAARDGVDVRLLVPGASDIPALQPLSRAGYRGLLEAGVRVYEWNGTMLHAKSAVADGMWTRIGSTNLNLASWMGNYELDVAIEDPAFAETMAAQYQTDLSRSTEIVLTARNRVRRAQDTSDGDAQSLKRARSGSAGRAAAGAVSVGSALGAALTNRRPLGPAESGLLAYVAIVVLALAGLAAMWPKFVAWPLAVIGLWLGVTWLGKAIMLKRAARRATAGPEPGAGAERR
jgi:cardiolipin synthase